MGVFALQWSWGRPTPGCANLGIADPIVSGACWTCDAGPRASGNKKGWPITVEIAQAQAAQYQEELKQFDEALEIEEIQAIAIILNLL